MDRQEGHRQRVGAAVARLRERFEGHVPFARVARHTGIPIGTLRRVLDGEQAMTLMQFVTLADAAQRPELELLGGYRSMVANFSPETPGDGSVWRYADMTAVAPSPAVQELTKAERVVRRHDGVEWIYMADGEVTLLVGTPPHEVVLTAGSAITIDASSPHRISEVHGEQRATIVRWMSAAGLRAHIPDQQDSPADSL
ncbi:cupin domain-containing protein [Curtobacterium flaccumfaciens]|uniref:cupin domain-containing protein n=1 Tax=Curtobacterium flaccumfaciens TaxID=2035 RepID=UPI00341EC918